MLGLGVAHVGLSDDLDAPSGGTLDYERIYECVLRIEATSWAAIVADVQYVDHPGGYGGGVAGDAPPLGMSESLGMIRSGVVGGVRIEIGL